MIKWCTRFLLIGILAICLLLGILYWKAGNLAETITNRMMQGRSGEVVVNSVTYESGGFIVAEVDQHVEPNLQLTGVSIMIPIMSLLDYRESLELTIVIDELRYVLAPGGDGETSSHTADQVIQSTTDSLTEVFKEISNQIPEIPLWMADIRVSNLTIEHEENTYHAELSVEFMKDRLSGISTIELRLKNEYLTLDSRLRYFEEKKSLSIDFSASANDWESFGSHYLPAFREQMRAHQIDLYVDPLVSGHFLETSGYLRWNEREPNAISAALLGNIGSTEAFYKNIEFASNQTAFGLATNGMSQFRTYVNVPITALRTGILAPQTGELSLRLDQVDALAVLALDQSSIEVQANDILQLMEGEGRMGFDINFIEFNTKWLHEILPNLIPFDLAATGSLQSSGWVDLAKSDFAGGKVHSTWTVPVIELSSKQFSASQIEGEFELQASAIDTYQGHGNLTVEALEFAGVALENGNLVIKSLNSDRVDLEAIRMDTLGGSIFTDALQLDLNRQTADKVDLALRAIDLKQLAAIVPQFQGDLTGAVSGVVSLKVSSAGVELLGGGLELDSEKGAHLSYPVNGLFTQGLKPGTASYKQYKMAERAFEDLSLQRFQIDFFPLADSTKPIRLTLFGESKQEGTIVPIDYTLNVNAEESAELLHLLQMMQRGELQFN